MKFKECFKKYWFLSTIILLGVLFLLIKKEFVRLLIGSIIFILMSIVSYMDYRKSKAKVAFLTSILMFFLSFISLGTLFLLPKYADLFILIVLFSATLILSVYYFKINKESILECSVVGVILGFITVTNLSTMGGLMNEINSQGVGNFLSYLSIFVFMLFSLLVLFILVTLFSWIFLPKEYPKKSLDISLMIIVVVGGYFYVNLSQISNRLAILIGIFLFIQRTIWGWFLED